jgi:pimeloyl-ACP methyl ester carboxylesterase
LRAALSERADPPQRGGVAGAAAPQIAVRKGARRAVITCRPQVTRRFATLEARLGSLFAQATSVPTLKPALVGLLAALFTWGCGPRVPTATIPKVTASGGGPVAGEIPSRTCKGDAPLDDVVKDVPNVRASWFNDATGSERLYVLEAGVRKKHRPSLVLIHGVGKIGTADFYPMLRALSRDRHVIAVDLPGFGRSKPEDDDFGPERLVRSVAMVVSTCASPELDVLGHSSGGAVAILFAARHKDVVRRLIVADVAGILRPEVLLRGQLHMQLLEMRAEHPVAGAAVEQVAGALIQTFHALTPDAKALGESGLFGDSPPVRAATALLGFDFGPAIAELRAPTLILWGKQDDVVPPRIGHLLHGRIAPSELVFIDGSGHAMPREQPEIMAEQSLAFLSRPRITAAPAPEPNVATRVGICHDREEVLFEGDYERIEVKGCHRVWLNKVRARRVEVRNSDGRIDDSEVSEGVAITDSKLSITGGHLRGPRALEVDDSELDVAGVYIEGESAAVYAHDDSELVFSVSQLKSARSERLVHEEIALAQGHAL